MYPLHKRNGGCFPAMLIYTLVTYGAKSDANRAARQQVRNVLTALKASGSEALAALKPSDLQVLVESGRSIERLTDLPILLRVLKGMKAQARSCVFVDDLRRLFRICPFDKREALLADLSEFNEHILAADRRKLLKRFTQDEVMFLCLAAEGRIRNVKDPSPRRGDRSATEAARAASKLARAKGADQKADVLDAVRRELSLKGVPVTNQMIADKANERGLLTTRGGEWRRDTVCRALKRFDDRQDPPLPPAAPQGETAQ